jgi:hypothetical protein
MNININTENINTDNINIDNINTDNIKNDNINIKNEIKNINNEINEIKQQINILMEKIFENNKNKITIKNINIDDTKDIQNIIKISNIEINEIKQKINILIENVCDNSNIKTKQNKKNKLTNTLTENVEIIKKKKKTKAENYKNERQVFIEELEKKMGLDENNRTAILHDLENNEELKKYLKEKIPYIRKLYKSGSWNYFKTKDACIIGLLKSIFKTEKYNIMNKQKSKEINGIKKNYSILHFFKT